jgi:hypothetical protein
VLLEVREVVATVVFVGVAGIRHIAEVVQNVVTVTRTVRAADAAEVDTDVTVVLGDYVHIVPVLRRDASLPSQGTLVVLSLFLLALEPC